MCIMFMTSITQCKQFNNNQYTQTRSQITITQGLVSMDRRVDFLESPFNIPGKMSPWSNLYNYYSGFQLVYTNIILAL